MSRAVIALKYLEAKTPQDLVEQMLMAHKAWYGYTFVDDDGVNVSAMLGYPDAKGLVESQDVVKAQTLYVFGAKAPELDEDLQPWEMLRNSKNEIVCAGLFEGTFEGFAKEGTHVAAYHAKEALSKKLKMLLRACKDDGEALYQECKSEEFQEEVKELIGNEGSVVLHFANNNILWFCSPIERKKTTPFGMFSDMCGWEAPKEKLPDGVHAVPEKKPVAKGLDKIAALMAAKQTSTPVPPTPKERTSEAPKPSGVPSVKQGGPTTYRGILESKGLRTLSEDKIESLMAGGGPFRHLENWYRNVGQSELGIWPAGHDRHTIEAIWNRIRDAYKSRGDWKSLVKELPGTISKQSRKEAKEEYDALVKAGLATDVGDKVTVTNKVEASKDDVVKKVTPMEGVSADGEFLPTISEKSQVQLQEFVDKYFDKSHKAIPIDPTKLKAYQDKYPNILEKMGVKSWSDTFGLPLEAFQMIAQRHDLARLFMFSAVTEIERLQRLVPASQQAPVSETKSMLAGLPGARKRA